MIHLPDKFQKPCVLRLFQVFLLIFEPILAAKAYASSSEFLGQVAARGNRPGEVLLAVDDQGIGFSTNREIPFMTASVLNNDSNPEGLQLLVQSFDSSETTGLVHLPIGGSLDAGFGDNGAVILYSFLDSYGRDVAYQPDGSIVVLGQELYNFIVVRYKADGTPDSSFGEEGVVHTDFGGIEMASAVLVQRDGKIIAAGNTSYGVREDFAMIRYTSNGSLDPNFNGGGKVTTDFSNGFDYGRDLVLQPDGKIIMVGDTFTQTNSNRDIALVRYNPDGSLNPEFNGNGKVTTDITANDYAWAAALQPDGKILVSGSGILLRYLPNGILDNSFDGDGKVSLPFDGTGIAIQPDGKIIVGGTQNSDFALARYTPNGSLDSSFGGDGLVISDFSAYDQCNAIALQADGKIVVAGQTGISSYVPLFTLARYNPDGSLDISFDGDGLLTTSFLDEKGDAQALAIQPNGQIIAVGADIYWEVSAYSSSMVTVRYNGGSSFDYDPNGQFDGLLPGQHAFDHFSYVVSNGIITDTATVTITIYNSAQIYMPFVVRP